MEIKITNYSCYDNGIVSKTENVCNVIDKMIQLAAKLTERFASDIIYDINNLNDAITLKKHMDDLLFFRENGVTTREPNKLTADGYDAFLRCVNPIQIWRLTHNPDTTETKLIRVHIRKVGLV
jgi:hypothetical protein